MYNKFEYHMFHVKHNETKKENIKINKIIDKIIKVKALCNNIHN